MMTTIKFKNRRGVSMVEVAVVIAILALFAMILYPVMYYSSHIYTTDNARSILLEKGQYALNMIEREIRNSQRITRIKSNSGKAVLELLRLRDDQLVKSGGRMFEEFSFDSAASGKSDWLRFRKGVQVNENNGAHFAKVIDGVTKLTFTGYKDDGTTEITNVNHIYSVGVSITIKDKFDRVSPVTVYGRATLRTHHNLTNMLVYYDPNRSRSWTQGTAPEDVKNFFQNRGFTVVNAKKLQKAMIKAIKTNTCANTVVVMSQDVVPDTVAENALQADTDNNGNLKPKLVSNNPTNGTPYFCLIRQFMNAGGRVVWYGDIPFYYVDENGTRKKWGAKGSEDVLGIKARTNNTNSHITSYSSNNDGRHWGLSRNKKNKSKWPTDPKYLNANEKDFNSLNNKLNSGFSTILAKYKVQGKEYAAAYYRNYDVSHPGSGFVRIFDKPWNSLSIHNLQDMFRVATYETTFYLPFKHVVYYDSLFPTSWVDTSTSKNITKYLRDKGFFALDAQQLQAFMQNAIFYNKKSDASDNSKPYSYTVVVFSKDVAPDTVANIESDKAIIRRYMNKNTKKYGKGGNGRVVWIGDIPFYYQGHFYHHKNDDNQNRADWGDNGSQKILGFDAGGRSRDDDDTQVTITSGGSNDYGNGKDWGLKTQWNSVRPEEKDSYFFLPPQPQYVDEDLAYYYYNMGFFSNYREISAWFKQYGTNKKGGFVRIWDYSIGSSGGISGGSSMLKELKNVSLYKWP